ncbi:MAG: O-antigen ligase family protein, partial [Candidatus Daviesbacteria bacterium]|nr:O-antigen ligase family protein [Candidatus Daviesbacteria bacterium]
FKSRKLTKFAAAAVALLLIFLSGSRAGLIGFGIEMAFIWLTTLRVSILKSVTISIILILLALFLPFIEGGGWFENRGQIWQTALQAGLESPILGQGFGNIQDPIRKAAIKLNNPVQYQVVDSAHNFILDWWIQGGIVGVISLLTLIFLSIQGFTRHKRVLEATALLGVVATMLFNPLSVVNLLAFWWLLGQGFEKQHIGL